MTLTADAANVLISDFGEDVTVHPQADDVPEDASNPVYFEQTASGDSSFTQKVRVYSSPSQEMLETYGFEEDTDAVIYADEDVIDEGDEVVFGDGRFVVRRTVSNQIGHGAYIWIHDLVGV